QASLSGQASVGGGLGASPLKASLGVSGSVSKTWNAGDNQQTGTSLSQEVSHNQTESHSMDEILRGVKEGSYRDTNEGGQRMWETFSSSLDRAQQEQESARQQFKRAETYRDVATKAEENSVSINSNATQEFMEGLRHNKQSTRNLEQTMVNNPEQ